MARKKVEKHIESEEETRIRRLNYLKDEIQYSPEPTYFFKVGENVSIGNLEDCIIEEVLENGKVYYVDYTKIDNNYGNPIRREHNKEFWMWYQIRPLVENKEHNLIKNKECRLSYMQQSIGSLFSKVYRFGVDFCPDYQRDFVWNMDDKIALIDSIFNNIDIGKFVFIDKEYGEKYGYEILDGKQRLSTICEFYENKFQYKGLYYNNLSEREKDYFEDYHVSVAEIQEPDRKQILKYFLMLNKQGRIMSKEQLDKVENMLNECE